MKTNLTLVLLGVILATSFCTTPPREKPNIVLIITDDLWDHEYGFLNPDYLTPAINTLANEGIHFENTYTSPVCSSARYSILSGKYACRAENEGFVHDTEKRKGQTFVSQNSKLRAIDHSIAKVLQQNGYATGIVGKTDGISKKQDFATIKKDWDPLDPEVAARMKQNQQMRIDFLKKCGFTYAASIYRGNIQPQFSTMQYAVHNQEWITKGAVDFIETYRDESFFLVMANTLMHAPSEYAGLNGDPLATEAGRLEKAIEGVQASRKSVIERIEAAGLNPMDAAPVLWLDDGIAAVMEKVGDVGQLENTLFIFINDNSHEAKGSPFEGGINTRMFLYWKGNIKGGSTISEPAMNMDIAATIFDVTGANVPTDYQVDGMSLSPFFQGQPEKWRPSVYFEFGFAKGVRMGNYKYHATRIPDGLDLEGWGKEKAESSKAWKAGKGMTDYEPVPEIAKPMGNRYGHMGGNQYYRPEYEVKEWKIRPDCYFDTDKLFDLSKDPLEQKNLAGDPGYSEILERCRKELKVHLQDLPGIFGEFKTEKQ